MSAPELKAIIGQNEQEENAHVSFSFSDYKIRNIVGSCDVKFRVSLEKIMEMNRLHASYEPELFPGLTYRMENPKVVVLVFISGKIIITGAKEASQIYDAFNNIYPILKNCKRD